MEVIKRTPPDSVLTDICMPYMDGIELAKYIFENCPDTKTVIISGYDEFGCASEAGCALSGYGIYSEPITPAELTEVLGKARKALDETYARTKTLKKLKGAYQSNRVFLRSRFLNSLLRGDERQEGLEEKMKELEVSLPGPFYNTAIVEGDDLSPFLNQYREIRGRACSFFSLQYCPGADRTERQRRRISEDGRKDGNHFRCRK